MRRSTYIPWKRGITSDWNETKCRILSATRQMVSRSDDLSGGFSAANRLAY